MKNLSNSIKIKGYAKVTLGDLGNLPTPPPLGSPHKPLPHSQFVLHLTEALEEHGWKVQDMDLTLAGGATIGTKAYLGTDLFGTAILLPPKPIPATQDSEGFDPDQFPPGLGYLVAFAHSTAGRFASKISPGAWIIPSRQAIFSGANVLPRLACRDRLPHAINTATREFVWNAQAFLKDILVLQGPSIGDFQLSAFLFQRIARKEWPARVSTRIWEEVTKGGIIDPAYPRKTWWDVALAGAKVLAQEKPHRRWVWTDALGAALHDVVLGIIFDETPKTL